MDTEIVEAEDRIAIAYNWQLLAKELSVKAKLFCGLVFTDNVFDDSDLKPAFNRRVWTDAEVSRLTLLCNHGVKQRDIAKELNRTLYSVKHKVKQLGFKPIKK